MVETKSSEDPKAVRKGQFMRHVQQSTLILQPKFNHTFTLIWLHDMGEQPDKHYFTLGHFHTRVGELDCKVILPEAPVRKVVCELGDEVNAWYDVRFTGKPDREMGTEFFNIWYDQE